MHQPKGSIEGLSLHHYHVGQVYDLAPTIAAYLVAEGFAVVEMRSDQKSAATPSTPDRRRPKPGL